MIGGMELVLMLLLGQGGNELVNYVDTDTYWNCRGVAISVEAMEKEIKNPEMPAVAVDQGNGGQKSRMLMGFQKAMNKPKAKAFNRLIAIKTLGVLKDKKAIPILKPLVKSTDSFVSESAKRAIALIEGVKYVPSIKKVDAKRLLKDLEMLPSNCGIVGQVTLMPGSPDIRKLITKMSKRMMGMSGMDEDRIQQQISESIQMSTMVLATVGNGTGNIRIDSVTMGIARVIGNNPSKGFVVVIARGKYDAKAVLEALKENGGGTVAKESGIDCFVSRGDVSFLLPSDKVFVFIAGASPEEIKGARVATAKAITTGKGGLAPDSSLIKLMAKNDPKKVIRFAAEIGESYRRLDILEGVETVSFTLDFDTKADKIEFILKYSCKDAEIAVKTNKMLKDLIEKANANANNGNAGMLMNQANIQQLLGAIKLQQDGKDGTVTMIMKQDASGGFMILPFLLLARYAR